jgi:hypothetical protein
MIHARRQTLGELTSALNRVKVGDWIEVEANYSSRNCSTGGIGCVTNTVDVWSNTFSTDECPTSTLVDMGYALPSHKHSQEKRRPVPRDCNSHVVQIDRCELIFD